MNENFLRDWAVLTIEVLWIIASTLLMGLGLLLAGAVHWSLIFVSLIGLLAVTAFVAR